MSSCLWRCSLSGVRCLRPVSYTHLVSFLRIACREDADVDGILAFGSFSEEEINFLRKQSDAILFVNSDQKDYEFDRIIMDYEQGLKDMVHYLLDVKEYRSIGYIGGIYEKDGVRIGTHRLMGLTEILAQRGCYKEHYFCVGEISRESGYRLTRELLETDDVPEVLVLGNDEVCLLYTSSSGSRFPGRLCSASAQEDLLKDAGKPGRHEADADLSGAWYFYYRCDYDLRG